MIFRKTMVLESLFFSSALHPACYPLVSAMLNQVWTQTTATSQIMLELLGSGQLFVVGYDLPKPEEQELIQAAKRQISSLDHYSFIWTYTPDIPGVKRWHEKLGARDSGYRIVNARPGFSQPDVNMMDYSPSESEADEVYQKT